MNSRRAASLAFPSRPSEPSWADRLAAAFFSALYGVFLAALPMDPFKDRDNYLNYAENSLSTLDTFWELGPLAAAVNEPLWLLLNHGLSLVLAPVQVVQLIIMVSATTVSWLMLTRARCNPLWLVVLLFLPQVIKNNIVHLRQGAAIAVFLAGWFASGRPKRLLCFALAPFIHASFFFVLCLLVVARVLVASRATVLLRIAVGVATFAMVGWAAYSLAPVLGARQVEDYEFIANEISGLGFLLWSGVLALMLAQGRRFILEHSFALLCLGLYLSLYFVAEFSARIFESAMLVVLIAALRTTAWRRQALQVVVVFLLLYQYLTQLDQPALGFGI